MTWERPPGHPGGGEGPLSIEPDTTSNTRMQDVTSKNRPAGNGKASPGPVPSGVGALLRDERRNRSMDIPQIAQITRLREHILRAIEREAWDELPPQVFVKGFIRAYARALGLNERRVLDLYSQARISQVEPKPLVAPEKTGRGRRILLILLLGILGFALLYYWQEGHSPKTPPEPAGGVDEATRPHHAQSGGLKAAAGTPGPKISVKVEPTDLPPEQGPAPLETGAAAPESPPEPRPPLPEAIDPYPPPPADPDSGHVLVADVLERTWVQISVDQGSPRDFIFQPGSHLRWKAREGMELLIGNAAGIVLNYNGIILEDLGRAGEVIRVRLPEDVDRYHRGDH